jgi:hypothetical protein
MQKQRDENISLKMHLLNMLIIQTKDLSHECEIWKSHTSKKLKKIPILPHFTNI